MSNKTPNQIVEDWIAAAREAAQAMARQADASIDLAATCEAWAEQLRTDRAARTSNQAVTP